MSILDVLQLFLRPKWSFCKFYNEINWYPMISLGVTIGNSVKRLRGTTSQSDFAESLGVNPRTYQRYESGERIFPDDVLGKIVSKYDIELADLFESNKKDKTLAMPVSKMLKGFSSIPDEFYELAFKLSDPDAPEWEYAKAALENAIERKQEEGGKANHS